MAHKKPRTVAFRRKREQLTHYGKRLKLLFSRQPRLVARQTNKEFIAQIVSMEKQGDKVLAATNSAALKKLGWEFSQKNIPASYLTGLLIGKMALKAGIKEVIFDTGMKSPLPQSKYYAFLKGAVDSGLKIPHDPKVFPEEARITGKHIQDYATLLKKDTDAYSRQFAQYLKRKVSPETIATQFEVVKKKILGK